MEKEIKRDQYLNVLVKNMHHSFIKVITGVRRSGKSYLLRHLFVNYLLSHGVNNDHIIMIDLELNSSKKYLNPDVLFEYVISQIKDDDMYYLILDEVQKVDNFEALLMDFLEKSNIDTYVTGSNARFLSRDVMTEFRGRGFEIYVNPLSYKEYYDSLEGDKSKALDTYFIYGGLPQIVNLENESDKQKTLSSFFSTIYQRDLIQRYHIRKVKALDQILDHLSSSVGSLISPTKIYDKIKSSSRSNISLNTVLSYYTYLEDAFLIFRSTRYDLIAHKNIQAPYKYYFVDVGLRNSRLGFAHKDFNRIMENVVYNELMTRGFTILTGVVPHRNGSRYDYCEIDFVVNKGNERYYIQVTDNIDSEEKEAQELRSFQTHQGDFTKRILIIRHNELGSYYNRDGVLVMGIEEFLLNHESLKR